MTEGIEQNLKKCMCSDPTLAVEEIYRKIVNEFFPGDCEKTKKLKK